MHPCEPGHDGSVTISKTSAPRGVVECRRSCFERRTPGAAGPEEGRATRANAAARSTARRGTWSGVKHRWSTPNRGDPFAIQHAVSTRIVPLSASREKKTKGLLRRKRPANGCEGSAKESLGVQRWGARRRRWRTKALTRGELVRQAAGSTFRGLVQRATQPGTGRAWRSATYPRRRQKARNLAAPLVPTWTAGAGHVRQAPGRTHAKQRLRRDLDVR